MDIEIEGTTKKDPNNAPLPFNNNDDDLNAYETSIDEDMWVFVFVVVFLVI